MKVVSHQGGRPPRDLQDLVEHRPRDVRRVCVGASDDPAHPVLGAVPRPGVVTGAPLLPLVTAARPPLGNTRTLRPPVMGNTQH